MEESRESHGFDFWLGAWQVFDPEGRLVGTNRISPLFGGSALMEEWDGTGSVSGRSLSSWDAGRGAWHQTWMDSSGSTLLLDGGPREGSMVMEGRAPSGADGQAWDRHRITWTPAPDGLEVRQLWETSNDEGATWTLAFDGRYRRA
jgi:hypothetical protein